MYRTKTKTTANQVCYSNYINDYLLTYELEQSLGLKMRTLDPQVSSYSFFPPYSLKLLFSDLAGGQDTMGPCYIYHSTMQWHSKK